MVDVFVYVVVLNLAAEYAPQVITESFTISLLTAIMLKLVLEVVLVAKDRVKGRLRAATTPAGKVVGGDPAVGGPGREQVRRPHARGPDLR